MDQMAVNWLLGIFAAVIGFMLKVNYQAVKELQAQDIKLTDRLKDIEVLVAGNYVPRPDFNRGIAGLFKKLDRIEEKLDQKQDKPR